MKMLKKKPTKKQKNPTKQQQTNKKNLKKLLMPAANKLFFRSKCARKQEVNKVLTPYKNTLLVS